MAQKSILITGCSSGIGYDAAYGLRDKGWRVFASCRKAEDCDRLTADGFESPQLDYTDEATMDSALGEVLEATGGTLDALFNNGAFACPGAVEDLPTEALREVFDTNFFGYHTLTRKVIPVMRAQGSGRILQCSSVLGFTAMPWRGAYNSSKFALEGLTSTLRLELADTKIKVVLIQPGPITSRIRQNSIPPFEKWIDWEASPKAEQYRAQLKTRLYEDRGPDRFELPASAVTKAVHTALTHYNPKPRYMITTPTYLMAALKRILPIRAMDWVLGKV